MRWRGLAVGQRPMDHDCLGLTLFRLGDRHRVAKFWRHMLKNYKPPPMDEAVDVALQAYVAKRREEIGVAE